MFRRRCTADTTDSDTVHKLPVVQFCITQKIRTAVGAVVSVYNVFLALPAAVHLEYDIADHIHIEGICFIFTHSPFL